MQFHLDYTPKKPGFAIKHGKRIFLIGSCFSTHISSLLSEYRFNVLSNPHGIVFNPLSIRTSLRNILGKEDNNKELLLQHGHLFYSFLCHSSVHAASKHELLEKISSINEESFARLKNCDYLIITFGSAYYYHHVELNSPVANCHKQPGNSFRKELLTVERILSDFQELLNDLRSLNKNLKIIFTVSPVKHLKDGVIENNLSKATLILAAQKLVQANSDCHYFPAYELVNDDLRDYRFYKEDLAHPNQQAIDYVWNKFSDWAFDPSTLEINKEIRRLNLALNHKQMQDSEDSKLKEFIKNQKALINKLSPGLIN